MIDSKERWISVGVVFLSQFAMPASASVVALRGAAASGLEGRNKPALDKSGPSGPAHFSSSSSSPSSSATSSNSDNNCLHTRCSRREPYADEDEGDKARTEAAAGGGDRVTGDKNAPFSLLEGHMGRFIVVLCDGSSSSLVVSSLVSSGPRSLPLFAPSFASSSASLSCDSRSGPGDRLRAVLRDGCLSAKPRRGASCSISSTSIASAAAAWAGNVGVTTSSPEGGTTMAGIIIIVVVLVVVAAMGGGLVALLGVISVVNAVFSLWGESECGAGVFGTEDDMDESELMVTVGRRGSTEAFSARALTP